MITFPHAKINLGLFVCHKRPSDGYHILQTLFYPIDWRDALEIIPNGTTGECRLIQTGIAIDGAPEQNLCVKAYRKLQEECTGIPGCTIHLEKRVPFGAGLGGGSSDGAYTLVMLRDLFNLPISNERLEQIAAGMGADCAFFVRCANGLSAQYCEGIGHELEPYGGFSLKGNWLLVIKPPFGVSTREAYSNVHPQYPATSLHELLHLPLAQWKDQIHNDFEDSVFPLHPELTVLKQALYNHGAVYASMSGSGSACFAIFGGKPFEKDPSEIQSWFPEGYEINCHQALV